MNLHVPNKSLETVWALLRNQNRKQMSTQFLTSLNEDELKQFLKDAFREMLAEQHGILKEPQPEILNVQQAARFLQLKPATVYEKTSTKQIPHFKKGNKLYFYRSQLQEWIDEGKVKTSGQISTEAITFTLLKKSA